MGEVVQGLSVCAAELSVIRGKREGRKGNQVGSGTEGRRRTAHTPSK